MKGFGIEIKNTLLDPKHVSSMGNSIWLYVFLLDKITSVDNQGIGKVLGGKPIKYCEVKKEMGISQDTYTRWTDKLVAYPYITAKRTPYGIIFSVLKAHKRFRKNAESETERIRTSAESIGFRTNAESLRDFAESNKTVSVRQTDSIDKREGIAPKALTPSEEMRVFVSSPESREPIVAYLVSKGMPEPAARDELQNFLGYWSEKTKSGKKQRWETEKTFEVRRRLVTWFKNCNKFSKSAQNKYQAGKA